MVDDGYVFHAKSKSFGVQTRKVIAKRNYEIFLEKHGRERIQTAVEGLEANSALAPLRAKVSDAVVLPLNALVAALDSANHEALKVMFFLPGIGEGGSGGSHSIYQEVHGMRTLGLDAQIALRAKSFEQPGRVRRRRRGVRALSRRQRARARHGGADVIAATHFKSASLVAELESRRDDFLPAYYVQD